MKQLKACSGRTTIKVDRMGIKVEDEVAHNMVPFFVRAKYTYEPELRPLEDDPGCAEWFGFDTLYMYEAASFVTNSGVIVTLQPHVNLLEVLSEQQLEVIERALRQGLIEEMV